MLSGFITYVLWLLTIAALAYAAWTVRFFVKESRRERKTRSDEAVSERSEKQQGDIIGKSRFSLPLSGHTPPEAAVAPENEKDTEKENTFAQSNVPGHQRQIPPEELDEVFGSVPEGEDNKPLDVELATSESETFPDDQPEAEETEDLDDETEDLPIVGVSSALGVKFEEMGEAYRHVVHNPQMTKQEEQETGRVLLAMKETDMFEAIVSSQPEKVDKVNTLMETYLAEFNRKLSERSAEDNPPQGGSPSGFDVRSYMYNNLKR